jgi:hypothetical protein
VESRPLPGLGFQHTVALLLTDRPPVALVDSVVGLDNLAAGWAFALVEVVEETDRGFTVLVSAFGEGPEPTNQERADLEGSVAELLWADRQATQRAS